MKRASKWIVLAVALTFLFAMAAPAFAATQDTAAAKLVGLGIMEGDPDGSLRLGDTITRAEFAKISVVAAGMKDAADLLKSTPSRFSDVAAGAWYTGWINLAASQGYVKGYPDGTFKPNDKITNAEVITVLMRVLGYNDNLPGDWPVDYLAKAASIGITKDANVNAVSDAVRGDVAILTSATLEENVVVYSKDKEAFEDPAGGAEKLLAQSFDDSTMKKGVVDQVRMNKDDIELVINEKGAKAEKTYTMKSSAYVNGAADIFGAENKWAEYALDKDGNVSYIGLSNLEVASMTVSKYDDTTLTASQVSFDGKKYNIADITEDYAVKFYTNNTDQGAVLEAAFWTDADADGKIDAGEGYLAGLDALYLVKNPDGDVVAFRGWDYNSSVIDAVTINKDVVKFTTKSGPAIANLNTADDSYAIVKDGVRIEPKDVTENDVVVYDVTGDKGVDKFFLVTSAKKTGTMNGLSANSATADITVDSSTVKANSGVAWVDNKDNAIAGSWTGYIGNAVTVLLDPNGKARYVIAAKGEETATGAYMVVRGMSSIAEADGTSYYMQVFGSDGKAAYKVTNDTRYTANAGIIGVPAYNNDKINASTIYNAGTPKIAAGTIIEVQLNDNGTAKHIELPAAPDLLTNVLSAAINNMDDINDDLDRIKLGTSMRAVNADTQIWVADGALSKYKSATWKQVEKLDSTYTFGVPANPIEFNLSGIVDGSIVKVLVIQGEDSVTNVDYAAADDVLGAASKLVGVLTAISYDADGQVAKLLTNSGDVVSYKTEDGTDIFASADKKKFFDYELNKDGELSKGTAKVAAAAYNGVIKKVNATSITITPSFGADQLYFFADSVNVFDITADSSSDAMLSSVASLQVGDAVDLFKNTDGDITNVLVYLDSAAAPIANAVNGFVTAAGAVDADANNDTLDVAVGSATAGLTEDIKLEYKVADANPGAGAVADGSVAVSTAAVANLVVLDEIVLPAVATNHLWLRAVDGAGNTSAWVDFGTDK